CQQPGRHEGTQIHPVQPGNAMQLRPAECETPDPRHRHGHQFGEPDPAARRPGRPTSPRAARPPPPHPPAPPTHNPPPPHPTSPHRIPPNHTPSCSVTSPTLHYPHSP